MRGLALLLVVVACRPAPAPVAPPSVQEPPVQEPPAEPPPSESVDVVASPIAPAEPSTLFRSGEPAPSGLDAEKIREYARSQGDPHGGSFDLAQAFVGDAALASGRGTLFAIIKTNHGAIECELFDRTAARTVANFVGLARGTRPFLDPVGRAWITGRFYDGTTFHRVIASFMIQGGDRQGRGNTEIGYVIADEIDPKLDFEKAGVLAMANRGPNTASSQFFITVAPTPHLKTNHSIFGKCDTKVPIAISKVPVELDRPKKDVIVERIDFERR